MIFLMSSPIDFSKSNSGIPKLRVERPGNTSYYGINGLI